MGRQGHLFSLVCLVLVFCAWVRNSSEQSPEAGLRIMYRKPAPPDSIKQFLSVCFQLNKTELMNDTEFRDLLGTHMSEVSKKWMENGRLKELSEEEGKREFYEEIYRPFKHNLFLRFFGDTAEGQHYRIDSIQWQMRTMMELVNGDTLQFHTLLPGAGQEDKPYVVVKKLADIVVASGQFR